MRRANVPKCTKEKKQTDYCTIFSEIVGAYLNILIRLSTGWNVFSPGSPAGRPNGICAINRHESDKLHCSSYTLYRSTDCNAATMLRIPYPPVSSKRPTGASPMYVRPTSENYRHRAATAAAIPERQPYLRKKYCSVSRRESGFDFRFCARKIFDRNPRLQCSLDHLPKCRMMFT